MGVSKLSASTQNYLKVIWALQEWSDEPITATLVSAKIGLKLSSVSDAMKKLTEQGLLEHAPYGNIALSPLGAQYALAMVRRHRLIETFLVSALAYSWDEVHDEAEHLEHAVSDLMVERMDKFLGFPTKDPHGDPIPDKEGKIVRPQAIQLAQEHVGTRVLVERISDDDPELLKFFASQGILVDQQLQISPGPLYSEAINVFVSPDDADSNPNAIVLGPAAMQAIWVSQF